MPFLRQRCGWGQALTAELGFDSLMLVDLDEDIGKRWPEAGGLPDHRLSPETSIQDIIDHVVALLEDSQPKAAAGTSSGDEAATNPLTALTSENCAVVPISRFQNDLYLDSHVIGGQRVLPFAVAMDDVAAAALETLGGHDFQPFTVSNFELKRPVLVPDTAWLEVRVEREDGRSDAEVTLRQDGAISYRGQVVTRRIKQVRASPRCRIPQSRCQYRSASFTTALHFTGRSFRALCRLTALRRMASPARSTAASPAIGSTSHTVRHGRSIRWPSTAASSWPPIGSASNTGWPAFLWRSSNTGSLLRLAAAPELHRSHHFNAGQRFSRHARVAKPARRPARNYGRRHRRGESAEFSPFAPEQSGCTGCQRASAPGRTQPAPSTYQIEKFPEYQELKDRLQLATRWCVTNPDFLIPDTAGHTAGQSKGKTSINFSSYNYVENSGNPIVSAAAKDAIEQYGTSVSASRVASAAPCMPSLSASWRTFSVRRPAGFHLRPRHQRHGDRSHRRRRRFDHPRRVGGRFIIQGAKLSGAKRRPFPHNDAEALDRTLTSLREHYRRVLSALRARTGWTATFPICPNSSR